MGFREDAVLAIQAGRAAALAGEPVTACPYGRDNLLRSAWVRGYAAASPMPITE